MNKRTVLLLVAGVLLLLIMVCLALGIGTVPLSPSQVVQALANDAPPLHRQVVWELRLPRALIAMVAGALFGLSGAILQAMARNPLAEPGMTGVTAGGVLFAVIWLTGNNTLATPGRTLPIIALIGGVLASTLVTLLASTRHGTSDPVRLALVGVLVSAVCGAATSLMLVTNNQALGSILTWMIGSLNGRVWVHWHTLWPWAIVSMIAGLACARLANVLQLGDEIAIGLGVRLVWARPVVLLAAALLTASAVAVVGAIGFVGLLGPHIARRLVGVDARRVFPVSLVLSAILLLGADMLAQAVTLNPPFLTTPYRAGMPTGAVTALLGVPVLLLLITRR